MKTFNELTPRQQKQAIAYWLAEELKNIIEYGAYDVFLKEKIELAFQKADAMHTPWFVGEYIMESCREELTAMARYDAEYSVYNDKDDPAVVELYAIERVEIDEEEEAVEVI